MAWKKQIEGSCKGCGNEIWQDTSYGQRLDTFIDQHCKGCSLNPLNPGAPKSRNKWYAREGTCDACGASIFYSGYEPTHVEAGDSLLCDGCAHLFLKAADEMRKRAKMEPGEFWPAACTSNKSKSLLKKFKLE